MEAGRVAGKDVDLIDQFYAVAQQQIGKMTAARGLRVREQHLPRLRLVQRHVHRQQHELPVRGHRHGPAGQRHVPGHQPGAHGALHAGRPADRRDGHASGPTAAARQTTRCCRGTS